MALVSAAALAGAAQLGSLLIDVSKPLVMGLLQPQKKLASLGGEWKGLYRSPSSEVAERPEAQANVSVMCHESGKQTWKISQRGDRFTADITEKSKHDSTLYHWDSSGFIRERSVLVVSFLGQDEGRGTLYLSRHPSHNYYRGYIYTCDCNAPKKAVMLCPYVLYKADDDTQEKFAQLDPLIAGDQRCTSITESGLLPPVQATSAPCIP